MHRSRLLIGIPLLTAALLLGACGDDTPKKSSDSSYQAPQPTTGRSTGGDPLHGQTLFAQWRCSDCHGKDAQGQIGIALAATQLDFESFKQAVRQTRPPKPAFSEAELSDDDVRDLYAWVQTLPTSEGAAAAAELPEGEVLGMSVWTNSGCNTCHGPFAQGSADAPALAATTLAPDDFMAALRQDASTLQGHSAAAISDEWAARLYRWLVSGAAAGGGC